MGQKISEKKAIDEIIGTKKENLALRRYFYSENKKINDSTNFDNFIGEITSNYNNNNNNNNDNNNDDDNDGSSIIHEKNDKEKFSFRPRSVVQASSLIHPLTVYRLVLIYIMIYITLSYIHFKFSSYENCNSLRYFFPLQLL